MQASQIVYRVEDFRETAKEGNQRKEINDGSKAITIVDIGDQVAERAESAEYGNEAENDLSHYTRNMQTSREIAIDRASENIVEKRQEEMTAAWRFQGVPLRRLRISGHARSFRSRSSRSACERIGQVGENIGMGSVRPLCDGMYANLRS